MSAHEEKFLGCRYQEKLPTVHCTHAWHARQAQFEPKWVEKDDGVVRYVQPNTCIIPLILACPACRMYGCHTVRS
jgi:hypothetical protein